MTSLDAVGRARGVRPETDAGAKPGRPTGDGATAPLLPEPERYAGDATTAILQIFAEENANDAAAAKGDVERQSQAKVERRKQQAAALAAAEAAAKQHRGFFDAIGVGGMIGLATGTPVLVVADIALHMTHQTPKILRELEAEHPKAIELAAKVYGSAEAGAVLAAGALGPEAARAATSLAGTLVQETEVLGKKASDRVGAVMLVAGSPSAGAAVVVSQKDSVVADDIRAGEEAAAPYTQYVEMSAMVLAAATAIVASAGTATAPVVIVGVALSAGGTVAQKTKVLDPLVGHDAAQWIDGGATVAGAFVSGAGVAELGAEGMNAAAKALSVGADAVGSASKIGQALTRAEDATIELEVDRARISARRYELQAQALARAVDDVLERAKEIESDGARVRQVAAQVVQTQCETRELAGASWRG